MNNLYWIKENGIHLLKHNDTILVELSINIIGNSLFIIDQKNYTISRKGFWNDYYYITDGSTELVRITHNFWGSNGKISFSDGSCFVSEYKTKGGVLYMRFIDGDREILCYKTVLEKQNHSSQFQVGTSMVDAEKLLLLSALGKVLFATLFNDGNSVDDGATSILLTSI
jgi:hypothetical protein